jgi:hypothetical protein
MDEQLEEEWIGGWIWTRWNIKYKI